MTEQEFAAGHVFFRPGDAGDRAYLLHDGEVELLAGAGDSVTRVALLGPGDVFGEMALLTGETRAADVVALTDVVAIEITKDALQPVLRDHPDLAASISSKVMERRGSLDSLRNASNEDAHQSVLSRIRTWFGL